jgi:hypothetical protein
MIQVLCGTQEFSMFLLFSRENVLILIKFLCNSCKFLRSKSMECTFLCIDYRSFGMLYLLYILIVAGVGADTFGSLEHDDRYG